MSNHVTGTFSGAENVHNQGLSAEEAARRLLANGYDEEVVAEVTGIPVEELNSFDFADESAEVLEGGVGPNHENDFFDDSRRLGGLEQTTGGRSTGGRSTARIHTDLSTRDSRRHRTDFA